MIKGPDGFDYLTREEVIALPDGTPVVITWPGGNGPHTYYIKHDKDCVWAADKKGCYFGHSRLDGTITYEGKEYGEIGIPEKRGDRFVHLGICIRLAEEKG